MEVNCRPYRDIRYLSDVVVIYIPYSCNFLSQYCNVVYDGWDRTIATLVIFDMCIVNIKRRSHYKQKASLVKCSVCVCVCVGGGGGGGGGGSTTVGRGINDCWCHRLLYITYLCMFCDDLAKDYLRNYKGKPIQNWPFTDTTLLWMIRKVQTSGLKRKHGENDGHPHVYLFVWTTTMFLWNKIMNYKTKTFPPADLFQSLLGKPQYKNNAYSVTDPSVVTFINMIQLRLGIDS